MISSKFTLLLCLVTVVILCAGCGGGGGGSVVPPGGNPTGQLPLSSTAQSANGLTLTLSQSTAVTSVGNAVVYTATISNPTTTAINVANGGDASAGQTFPVVRLQLSDVQGHAVYPVLSPNNIQGSPYPLTSLASGQAITTVITVPAGSVTAAGSYSAVATFTVDNSTTDTTQVGPLTVIAQ